MSYRANDCQQLSISDSFFGLTSREQKALENSWAKVFSDEIFPAIDEERFSVLYSSKASRPNTPVNVMVGACIIKELFDYSDDEMVENLMLDLHLQFALHTTSFQEQPLSDKSLSRFRKRCYDYEKLYGVDLYHDCVIGLSDKIAKMMKLNGRIRRMDSMMIESNMRKLTRIELIYTCIAKLCKYIAKQDNTILPDEFKHYVEPNDFNQVIYHQRSIDADSRIEQLLKDSEILLNLCEDGYEDVIEYKLFTRCISEQTVLDNETRRLCTKDDKQLHSQVLQNPSDPEATFRTKAGINHVGYVANLEETVGSNGSIVTDYQYTQNIHSDSTFFKERLEELPEQKDTMTMITDGGYYSKENIELAKDKNIDLITTGLTGREVKKILNDFETDKDITKILRCPAGYEPKSCSYKPSDGTFKVSFHRACCENCPFKNQCNPKLFKRVARMFINKNSFLTLKLQNRIKSEEFRDYQRLRNGVETVPSNLRRNYNLEKLPRGLVRGKFFFANKIAALNFKKLFNYKKGLGSYAQNPLLA